MNCNKGAQLIIFTIYLNEEDSTSCRKNHLDKIAEIGGTEKAYREMTFKGLDIVFQDIANLINPKFGLKIK